MLKITVPATEQFVEATSTFLYTREQKLQMEHSLVSIARWESKWHKPFLGTEDKTAEQTIDYLRCMTITQNVDPAVYAAMSGNAAIMKQIKEYIDDSMTATWFSEGDGKQSREVVTAEIIYHWMIAYNIPSDREKWHLNRLLTLIRVCSVKNAPPEPISKQEQAKRNRALAAARRKQHKTRG